MGQDWTTTGYFPRVVYCDYMMHEFANVQRKTVQCALAINILNEKVLHFFRSADKMSVNIAY